MRGDGLQSEELLIGRAEGRVLPVAARLAAHWPETVDLLAADRGPGVVAGQRELGQVLHQVLGSGAAHMRVALHGHDRKVSVDSVN